MPVDVVVVGLGYVGLPLARRACEAGLGTAGLDVSEAVVAGLRSGRSHVQDVPDGDLAAMLAAGFTATTDPAVLDGARTAVICVPTGLTADGAPDLGPLRAAAATVAAHVTSGMLVVVESTSHPGTTEEIVRPILEGGSGLRVGDDFHLAYSPERIDPGNPAYGLRNTPKIVSGCTPLCTKYAVAFYHQLVDTLVVSGGTREAEMAKLLENTYRYVNIALVNEVALYCDRAGIDVWDVLHCAGTKPFGFAPFRPGAGVGGHCIPVDPRYLMARAEAEGFRLRTLRAAHEVLSGMPGHVVERAAALLRSTGRPLSDTRVTLLGVAYKPDVADTRETPAAPVARGLRELGVRLSYHDPLVPRFDVDAVPVPRRESLTDALAGTDLAVLLQDHSCYAAHPWDEAECAVLDTCGRAAGSRVTLL